MAKKIAVVTGANRGIGAGVAEALSAQGYSLELLGRNVKALEEKAAAIRARGGEAAVWSLDLADSASIEEAGAELKRRHHDGIHVLVNNAGMYIEREGAPYDANAVRDTLQTNTLGPLQLAVAVGPLLKKTRGVLVNISSGMGALKEMAGGSPGYRISKTALNAVTRYLAAEWKDSGVRVNSIDPGWVQTEMGGPGAQRSVDEAVKGIVWAATLPEGGPTGGFFLDGKAIDW
jgi:NAD(P)-dependent dehydrogenase (short-subunit alcohol dehydrogenase family)